MATILLGACSTLLSPSSNTDTTPPAAPREFRAMWIATVANIDWPSRAGLTTAEQQQEIKRIVATAKRLKMNALVLQVRPAADALYTSSLEPWSEYLSGVQGQAPQPFYDPLTFWINEAHANGIELHAWLNPYRARHSAAKSLPSANHLINTRPELVKPYGDQRWVDPGEPASAKRLLDVVRDVVRRYDIDGVHIDDYFYPYPVKAAADQPDVEFPDEPSWSRYVASGGKMNRADWRRDNINRLVQLMNAAVHAEKAWVKFGISPFGLPRADRRPEGITGFSQYDKLFADVELWWNQGWLDYLAPQLYWPIAQTAQSFPVLLDYWSRSNAKKRHLWPGLFTSKIDESEASWTPDEIKQQIEILRRDVGTGGHIHFSAVALTQNRQGVADLLGREAYANEALVPATPWLRPSGAHAIAAPVAALRCEAATDGSASACRIEIADSTKTDSLIWAVWARYGGTWTFSVATRTSTTLPEQSAGQALRQVVISRIDRYGVEGARSTLVRP
jgi:uncharacterized lipoprotein YddW (UPF0748 family)